MARQLHLPIDLRQIEQLLWNLLRLKGSAPGTDIAIVTSAATTYFSVFSPRESTRFTSSATVQLIQGLYESRPEEAHKILRNRIFTNAKLTEMCLGMIRVAAKRVTGDICLIDHNINMLGEMVEISQQPQVIEPGRISTVEFSGDPRHPFMPFMQAAVQLRDSTPRGCGPRYLSDRAIAAVLVSETHQILAWATNTNSKNKTLHAEINLIRSYELKQGRKLPRGSRIYTTLKPCKMCAGMIWNAAEDIRTNRIYYLENDPGPFAKFTVLNPGTHERLRASQDSELRQIQIEFFLNDTPL